ncbi:unnamed protein product [Colias eurytheme]|nr:unnamed protein product [Colias eurytheme]
MFKLIYLFMIELALADVYMNRVNHIEYYRNRTRPSKAFNSFSTSYFNNNYVSRPGKEKVQCGTRTVDFNLRRGKIVGGSEAPYGAFPWQVNGPHSNDIALLLVARSSGVQFNTHVRPICLPSGTETTGQWCAVSGWGHQGETNDNFAPVLRAAAVPILDLATCRKDQVLGGRQQAILDSMLCAGVLSGGVDACHGDSGGPLACIADNKWHIYGVVSWGSGCARRARPGVYTRVVSYLPWIRSTAASMGHRI